MNKVSYSKGHILDQSRWRMWVPGLFKILGYRGGCTPCWKAHHSLHQTLSDCVSFISVCLLVSGISWEFVQGIGTLKEWPILTRICVEKLAMKALENLDSNAK